jgi:hypothetical protein
VVDDKEMSNKVLDIVKQNINELII